MNELKKYKAYREKLKQRPFDPETYVLSELVESKISQARLESDLEDLRRKLEEKEAQIDLMKKVIKPFGLRFDGTSYLDTTHSYVPLTGSGASFNYDEAREFLDLFISEPIQPSEDESESNPEQ